MRVCDSISSDRKLRSTVRGFQNLLVLWVVLSGLLCLASAAVESGYEESAGMQDRNGYPVGFCDPVTWDHFRLFLRNSTPTGVINALGWYGSAYLVAHALAGFYLLVVFKPHTFGFAAFVCWLQPVVFPTFILGLIMLPELLNAIRAGDVDGEMISEVPFWWTFQPVWVVGCLISGIIFWVLYSIVGVSRHKLPSMASL